jgi:hypothetical protein
MSQARRVPPMSSWRMSFRYQIVGIMYSSRTVRIRTWLRSLYFGWGAWKCTGWMGWDEKIDAEIEENKTIRRHLNGGHDSTGETAVHIALWWSGNNSWIGAARICFTSLAIGKQIMYIESKSSRKFKSYYTSVAQSACPGTDRPN